MEVTGVQQIFDCSSCTCATCLRGTIHPQSTNDCPKGGCQICHEKQIYTPRRNCDDIKTN